MVNKKQVLNVYPFVDYNNNANVFAVSLPLIILAISMLTRWLMNKRENYFVRAIPVAFVIALSIMYILVIFKMHYKVIGTDKKIYILRGAKHIIINLSDIKKIMYTLNLHGYYDYNIIASDKMYSIKIHRQKEFNDYVNSYSKKCSNEENVSQCIISDRKIVYSSFIIDLLFVITLNILPIVLLITKIIANDYYWYVDKIMSLSWLFLFSLIPAILLICFASFWKKILLEVKKLFIVSLLIISIALLIFTISIFMQKSFSVSYNSIDIEIVENKVSYQFPKSALYESRTIGSVKEIVVSVVDEDEFDSKFSEIKENRNFIKCRPNDFPNDVAMMISSEEIDYCFVYSTKGLTENEIDYYKYDEYLIILINSKNYRFFIYDFSE